MQGQINEATQNKKASEPEQDLNIPVSVNNHPYKSVPHNICLYNK